MSTTDLLSWFAGELARADSPMAREAVVARCLERLGALLEVDRAYVYFFSTDGQRVGQTHEWCRPGICPQGEDDINLPMADLPWWRARLHETVRIDRVRDLPAEASGERALFALQGIRSLLTAPVEGPRGTMFGFLGVDSVTRERSWTADEVRLVQVLGTLLANELERHTLALGLEARDAANVLLRELSLSFIHMGADPLRRRSSS